MFTSPPPVCRVALIFSPKFKLLSGLKTPRVAILNLMVFIGDAGPALKSWRPRTELAEARRRLVYIPWLESENDTNMSLLRLRLSMLGTLAAIIAVSTLGIGLVLSMMGELNVTTLVVVVTLFNVGQWLLAPYLVNAIYKARQMEPDESPRLYQAVEDLSARSGIRKPKLMYSSLDIPNAFAYGSPLTGSHVAVTQGLLSSLSMDEVEAVIGHELGHIKHRDVQAMMFLSLLPSIFYIVARSTLFSRVYGDRDRRDSGALALVGGVSMLIYFALLLFNMGFSRLREYYADQHSAKVVENGAWKLSTGLAKITTSTARAQEMGVGGPSASGFKALFISDPDRALQDAYELRASGLVSDSELVGSIMSRRVTAFDRLGELFSTHPNIVKRLKALNA
jgi:heat shock protein HtpX